MELRNKLSNIALGGLLMLIGMLASSALAPDLFPKKDKFDEIECRSLNVVDAEGNVIVRLACESDSGTISIIGNDGLTKAVISATEHGGAVVVLGNAEELKASMGINKFGRGVVKAWNDRPIWEGMPDGKK